MASTVFPAASAASKTRYVVTLLSGTSYTVPAGVTQVIATLFGGGGNGGTGDHTSGQDGLGGQIITTTLATTPGNSIAYAIGAGGGGTTTFTGATSAAGGNNGSTGNGTGGVGTVGAASANGGSGGGGGSWPGSTGGAGKIELEYYV